jgi:hypothetical protein
MPTRKNKKMELHQAPFFFLGTFSKETKIASPTLETILAPISVQHLSKKRDILPKLDLNLLNIDF